MDNSYNALYVETVRLAREFQIPQSQVPQPFQLNELEQFNAELKARKVSVAKEKAEKIQALKEAAKAKANAASDN